MSIKSLNTYSNKTTGESLTASEWNNVITILTDNFNDVEKLINALKPTSTNTGKVERYFLGVWSEVNIGDNGYYVLSSGEIYVLSGELNSTIFIDCSSGSIGAKIYLNNVTINLSDSSIVPKTLGVSAGIYYNGDDRSLEVIALPNTKNYIYCNYDSSDSTGRSSDACILSDHNLTIKGTGMIYCSHVSGHGIKASKLNIEGDTTIITNVKHDGIHGTKIVNIEGGNLYFDKAKDAVGTGKRAEDGTEDTKLRGIIRVFGGNFYVNNITELVFDYKYDWCYYNDGTYSVFGLDTIRNPAIIDLEEDFSTKYIYQSGIYNKNVKIYCVNYDTSIYTNKGDIYVNLMSFKGMINYKEDRITCDGVEVIATNTKGYNEYICNGSEIIVNSTITGRIVVNTQSAEVHLLHANLYPDANDSEGIVIEYTPSKKQLLVLTDKNSGPSYIHGTIKSNNNCKLTPKDNSWLYILDANMATDVSTLNICNGGGTIYVLNNVLGLKATEYFIGMEEDETDHNKIFTGNLYANNNDTYDIYARLNSAGTKKGTITVLNTLDEESNTYVDKIKTDKSIKETTVDTTGIIKVIRIGNLCNLYAKHIDSMTSLGVLKYKTIDYNFNNK